MADLTNLVALVTGSSRGGGRGIALEFGAAGATVYVTGRSIGGGATTDGVPGTIDETARDVTARGGRGIAVRCDHTVDTDVELLFDRIRADHGRLDLLVNNVWGGFENSDCRPLPLVPFWEQSLHQSGSPTGYAMTWMAACAVVPWLGFAIRIPAVRVPGGVR